MLFRILSTSYMIFLDFFFQDHKICTSSSRTSSIEFLQMQDIDRLKELFSLKHRKLISTRLECCCDDVRPQLVRLKLAFLLSVMMVLRILSKNQFTHLKLLRMDFLIISSGHSLLISMHVIKLPFNVPLELLVHELLWPYGLHQ